MYPHDMAFSNTALFLFFNASFDKVALILLDASRKTLLNGLHGTQLFSGSDEWLLELQSTR
jgi:hypothetical protein